MRQQLYLDSRYGAAVGGSAVYFWLQEPIVLPGREYQFNVSVPHASLPLTHWVVNDRNNKLHLVYGPGSAQTVELPQGNYSVDELAAFVNVRLENGFRASYSESTNLFSLSTSTPNTDLQIGPETTCGKLLGFRVGDGSVLGFYQGPDGVDLQGTSSFYIRSNIRTRNRDPKGLGYSSILSKIPITRAANGIERFYEPGFTFGVWDKAVFYIVIEVLDDDLEPVVFHGGSWSMTVEFDVVQAESFRAPIDYRVLMTAERDQGAERGGLPPTMSTTTK